VRRKMGPNLAFIIMNLVFGIAVIVLLIAVVGAMKKIIKDRKDEEEEK
jgi:F0F1-type ATP synthase membrane subunit b/b'